jgi:hypothetical protein
VSKRTSTRLYIGAWGGLLMLHLVVLGIIGMVAYAAAGPEEIGVTRPTVT